jgi:hypothetical protein
MWEGRKNEVWKVGGHPQTPGRGVPLHPLTLILNCYARAITGILSMDVEAVDDVWSYGL